MKHPIRTPSGPDPGKSDCFKIGDSAKAFTVARRGKKGTFNASFQDEGGHKRRSLHTASLTVAEKKAWKLYDELTQGTIKPAIKPMALSDAADLYIKFKEADNLSAKTIDRARTICDCLIEFLAGQGVKTVGSVTLLAIDRYLQSRTDLANNSRRVYAIIFKQWFRFLVSRKLLPDDPLAGLEVPKYRHRQLPPVRPNELGRILAAATSDVADVLRLLAFTGLRSSEATHLLVRNVDLTDNVIRVRNTDIHTLKNDNAVRDIPVHRNLRPVLLRVIGERRGGRVLIRAARAAGRGPEQVWTKKLINDEFSTVTANLGIVTGRKKGGVTANALRSYFKTTCRDELIPESLVDRWCGHAVHGMDKHYYDSNKTHELMNRVPFGVPAGEVEPPIP